MRIRTAAELLAAVALLAGCSGGGAQPELLQLPPGFTVEVLHDDFPGARSLAVGDDGTLFVSTRNDGVVYALQHGRRYIVVDGADMPNGIAFHDGNLYVAEVSRVVRYRDILNQLGSPPAAEVVVDGLPSDRHHGWKFIAFGPDGALYVPIGAPCNVCEEEGYARILRVDVETGVTETFATGVRNTIGFDFHPETGALWFTDNGRDWLGDDLPPDELNHAPQAGMDFGFPYCHGHDISDPEYTARGCDGTVPPVQVLGAHVAALGMRFYTGDRFPPQYRGQVFIAEHGSWNRTQRSGYRVSLVRLDGNRAVSYEPFITGWLQPGGSVWGRPVDVLVTPDGALLISDDLAGKVYRVTYTGEVE